MPNTLKLTAAIIFIATCALLLTLPYDTTTRNPTPVATVSEETAIQTDLENTATPTTKNSEKTLVQTQQQPPTKEPQAKLSDTAFKTSNCVHLEDIQQTPDEEDAFWGQHTYDQSGNLSAEFEYLHNLELPQLEDLATGGYDKAMVVLSEQLMLSNETEKIAQGREWAFSAAVNGHTRSLLTLALSHLTESGRHKANGDASEATNSAVSFHSTLNLLGRLAPSLSSELSHVADTSELNEEQREQIGSAATQLTNKFKTQRENLGLRPLSEIQPQTTSISEDVILCDT